MGGKNPKSVWWKDELQLGERELLGRRCWELGTRLQKTDVWRFTNTKRERLKGVYVREKYGKEDESGCR